MCVCSCLPCVVARCWEGTRHVCGLEEAGRVWLVGTGRHHRRIEAARWHERRRIDARLHTMIRVVGAGVVAVMMMEDACRSGVCARARHVGRMTAAAAATAAVECRETSRLDELNRVLAEAGRVEIGPLGRAERRPLRTQAILAS